MTSEGLQPTTKKLRLKFTCSGVSARESTSTTPRGVVESSERRSAAMPKGAEKGAEAKGGTSESKGETVGTESKKRTKGGVAEGEMKKQKVEVEEWEEELPPAFVKILSPAGSKTTQMSGQSGARTLAKLQKSFTSTTLREQVQAYIPNDLRSFKADGVVEVPLAYLDTSDMVLDDETITFNPRQMGQDGIRRIRQRFRINGFDSDKSILTGVLTYEGKQFPMTKAHMDKWDEVEREIVRDWKQYLQASKDKSKLALYLWHRLAGGSLNARGFRIKITDGRHRIEGIRQEQAEHFYNKDLDPNRARHPMLKVQLLNIMEDDRGKLLQHMNTTNDYTAEGVQEQSLPMNIMTVRKTLLGLTEKTVAEFPSDLVDALQAMSDNKLSIQYTTYKPKGTTKVLKIPKLLVAMMCDRPFEDDVTNWKVPDKAPDQTAFYKMCDTKQDQYMRLIGGANTSAGPAWDKVLEDLAVDPQIAAGLLYEDLYALTGAGMSEDWCVRAARAVFVKTRVQSEEDGWMRGQLQNRQMCKMLAYVYEATCEGVLWLREIGVLKDEKPLKGGMVDLSVTFASKEMKDAFRGPGYMHFPEWVQTLVFAPVPKGQCETRFLFKQGAACRAKATSKDKSKDVEEAGRRAVCPYLLWLFPPSEPWWNLETLYASVPAVGGLKTKVVEKIKTGEVIGKKWEAENAAAMGYKVEEELAMGLPLERDCGGMVPPVLLAELGAVAKRKYITREDRAKRMGYTVDKPQLEGEGEVVTFNDADMYNIVSDGDTFDCPTIESVRAGCEQLHMMAAGKWEEKGNGVDVVWLNVPLPRQVAEKEAAAKYDIKLERHWEKNALSDALNLAKDLITSAGIVVVVAPPGFPTNKLTEFSLGATGVAAEVRSIVTLCFESKGKAKATAKPLYGTAGNTIQVIYCTAMGSSKLSACSGTVPDILADVPFVSILRRHGTFKMYNLADWEESGEGLPRKVVQSLVGGLLLKGGTGVVLNAKGGREASVLSKGGMKVVAAYSEKKSSFQGPLIDTRTGKQYGGAASKQAAEESPVELVAAALAEQKEKEMRGEEEGGGEGKAPAERAADVDQRKVIGLDTQPKPQPRSDEKEGGGEEGEGDMRLEVLPAWGEEEEPEEGEKGEIKWASFTAGRGKKKRAPLPDSVQPGAAFAEDNEELESMVGRLTQDEKTGPGMEEIGGFGGLGDVEDWGGLSAVKEASDGEGSESSAEKVVREGKEAETYIAAQNAARIQREAGEAERKKNKVEEEEAEVERREEVAKLKEEASEKKEEEAREKSREGKGEEGSGAQGGERGKKEEAKATAGEAGGGSGQAASSQPPIAPGKSALMKEPEAAQRALANTRRSKRGKK